MIDAIDPGVNSLSPPRRTAWIMIFGLILLMAPPLNVGTSLSLFIMGVFAIPALAMIPNSVRRPRKYS